MALQPIQRGSHQDVEWTYLDTDGSPRPFAAGEYGTMCIGQVTPLGTADLVSKSTNVSGEGSTTIGSPVASFLLTPDDGLLLPASSYSIEFWLVLTNGHRKKVGNACTIQVVGMVCAGG